MGRISCPFCKGSTSDGTYPSSNIFHVITDSDLDAFEDSVMVDGALRLDDRMKKCWRCRHCGSIWLPDEGWFKKPSGDARV